MRWPPNTLQDVPRHPNRLFLRKPNALLVIVLGSHRVHNSFRLEFQGQTLSVIIRFRKRRREVELIFGKIKNV